MKFKEIIQILKASPHFQWWYNILGTVFTLFGVILSLLAILLIWLLYQIGLDQSEACKDVITLTITLAIVGPLLIYITIDHPIWIYRKLRETKMETFVKVYDEFENWVFFFVRVSFDIIELMIFPIMKIFFPQKGFWIASAQILFFVFGTLCMLTSSMTIGLISFWMGIAVGLCGALPGFYETKSKG